MGVCAMTATTEREATTLDAETAAAKGARQERVPRGAPRAFAAKLTPPALPRDHLTRTALHERLDDAFGRTLTTVVAAPGFGKTTLVASWAAELRSAWYTVDRSDATLAAFAAGLADALEFRELASDRAGDGSAGDERGWAERLAGLFAENLDHRLTSDFFLVLDDLHELDPNSASARLVEALCRQAPPLFHLVLVSRSEPPFPIERLRGRGQVISIGAPDLAFHLEEVRAVLGAEDERWADALAEEVHRLTAGWPAAVRLIAEALRGGPDEVRERLKAAGRAGGSLFTYLAEEVFESEPEDVRDLLRIAKRTTNSPTAWH